MTYARKPKPKPKPKPKCRMCKAVLYSRTELPGEISALCIPCSIAHPGEAGPIFRHGIGELVLRARVGRRVHGCLI
jgi:hypothetical protein